MFDQLRDLLQGELASRQVAVLSLAAAGGPEAMPVRYRSQGLTVDCLVPRWSDLAYYLQGEAQVLLVVLTDPGHDGRWLRCRGTARPLAAPDWAALLPGIPDPSDLYLAVRVQPSRLDLIDQARGWGARETLDLA